jgi:hypothetical protein
MSLFSLFGSKPTRRTRSCRLTVDSLDDRINPGVTSCTPEPPKCPPPPSCEPPPPPTPCDNGNHKGHDKDCKVKGNNGVGNGLDPQPPGNPPVNDGDGTVPGSPGNRGGANK